MEKWEAVSVQAGMQMAQAPSKSLSGSGAGSSTSDVGDAAPAVMEPWGEPVDCRRCELRPRTIFSALRGSDFAAIAPPIECASLPAGTVVYSEGAAADAVYTLCSGLVQLTKASPAAAPRTVRLLGGGAPIGLEALAYGLYWHTANALRDTRLCRVPLRVIEQLWSRNSDIGDRLILEWSRHVAQADRWLVEFCTGPMDTRVRSLIRLLLEVGDGPADEIELPTLDELAGMLGASAAAISRTLAELKRDGVLRRVAPHTYACDLEALSC